MFGNYTRHIFRNPGVPSGPPEPPSPTAEAEILRLIGKLNQFVFENTNSPEEGGIRAMVEMVKGVRKELRLFLEFLADKKLEEGSILKYWIDDAIEIAHDAHLLARNQYLNRFRLSVLLQSNCISLSNVRKCILQLGVEGANKSPITSSSSSPPHGEGDGYENVVGLEEEAESVLRKLAVYHGGIVPPIMCIVGMAGVGKTTLARKVYNHPTMVDRYDLRAWVSVSDELSNKEVLMKLILQLVDDKDQSVLLEEMENADNGSLQRMLEQHLSGKRFLIVLDNIGKMQYLDSIYKILPPEYEKQIRLLITSRFRRIQFQGVIFRPSVSTLEMKPLDDDQSWELFLRLLLFSNENFPKKLERKGREMLRSCDGLPLSIKEVATQFIIKRQGGSEWEQLLESPDLSVTLAVLQSMYNKWPPLLKSCFLCLSFFKKGTPIRREKLLQVWSAAQVIPHEYEEEEAEETKLDREICILNLKGHGDVVKDSLEGYKTTLIELLDESVIDVDKSKKQHIKRIRVNASFHTLSLAKAEEERVLETLKKGKSNPPPSQEPRHRSIYCSRDEFNHFTDHDERLVSFFFRGGGYFDSSETYWKRFEQLRTLDFEGFGLKMLPDAIGALIELRYLGLRDNYIKELPQSLGRLKNLEVLDIELNFTVELLDIIWKISSLRHLYISDIICQKPLKIDTLKNLTTLTFISIDNWTYEVSRLKMMTSLRKLGIEGLDGNSDVSKLFASLADLSNLDCLILRGFRFRSLPPLHGLENLDRLTELELDGLMTNQPSADIFPPNITHLSLINSCLDEDPIPELEKMNKLSYLRLKNAYTGQQMVIRSLSPDILCIEELWHLRSLQVDSDRFRLEKLKIKSCPFLKNIPENLFSYQMEEMKMVTTRKLAAKIRKSDFISNIEHVNIQP